MMATRATPRRRARLLVIALLLAATVLEACAAPLPTDPTPTASPLPDPSVAAREAADLVTRKFVANWRGRRYERMVELMAPVDRERYGADAITGLLRRFDELARVTRIVAVASGAPLESSLPPESGAAGPIPALEVPISLVFETDLFGEVAFRRMLTLTEGGAGWEARWRPALLFPQLGDDHTLALERTLAPRGRILGADGTVYAENREDGMRVYPQESLAGQTIGFVQPVSDEEAETLAAQGYALGEPLGRSGLEEGAEALLRGSPGLSLVAVPPFGVVHPVLERPMVPGADLTITIRRDLQATADAALSPYADAATAVIDPKTGDVWALASAPRFNPNAMTLGTTLAGQTLAKPSASVWLNRAVLGAYPAGSSFKPFALLAALETGVATPSTRMSCFGTWTFSGFTFHNYLDHTLGGSVSLEQAMAFSCNTTYMPLSIRVWDADREALPNLVGQFGFGASTGITHLADASGILPDARHFEFTPRRGGTYSPYGPFDQIQLAIGQGSFLGTPLQLANAYAAFGNGGTLWRPRLVTQATLPDGTVIERNESRVIRQVDVSPESFAYLARTLRAVITLPYGTANRAFAGFGIPVGGKSGTAETGTPRPHAWFPAYAPIGDAEIAVATVLVHVRLATGGTDAAPLVRRVMARYFFP